MGCCGQSAERGAGCGPGAGVWCGRGVCVFPEEGRCCPWCAWGVGGLAVCGSQKVQAEGGCAEGVGRGMALRLHTLDAGALCAACAVMGCARASRGWCVHNVQQRRAVLSGVGSTRAAACAAARWALGECAAPDAMGCVPCAGKDAFALRGLVESLVFCIPTSCFLIRITTYLEPG